MTELKSRIGQAWLRHPVIDGLLSGAVFVVVSLLLINFVLPAWAASFPVGDLFVVNLGDWAPWVGISVTLFIWWDVRKAKNKADEAAAKASAGVAKIEAVSVQIDGLLAARDKAKVEEGVAQQKIVGEDTAATLAKGQEEGRASERERVASQAPSSAEPSAGKAPLPVVDDRTAGAAERSAAALERTASATEEKK